MSDFAFGSFKTPKGVIKSAKPNDSKPGIAKVKGAEKLMFKRKDGKNGDVYVIGTKSMPLDLPPFATFIGEVSDRASFFPLNNGDVFVRIAHIYKVPNSVDSMTDAGFQPPDLVHPHDDQVLREIDAQISDNDGSKERDFCQGSDFTLKVSLAGMRQEGQATKRFTALCTFNGTTLSYNEIEFKPVNALSILVGIRNLLQK